MAYVVLVLLAAIIGVALVRGSKEGLEDMERKEAEIENRVRVMMDYVNARTSVTDFSGACRSCGQGPRNLAPVAAQHMPVSKTAHDLITLRDVLIMDPSVLPYSSKWGAYECIKDMGDIVHTWRTKEIPPLWRCYLAQAGWEFGPTTKTVLRCPLCINTGSRDTSKRARALYSPGGHDAVVTYRGSVMSATLDT